MAHRAASGHPQGTLLEFNQLGRKGISLGLTPDFWVILLRRQVVEVGFDRFALLVVGWVME